MFMDSVGQKFGHGTARTAGLCPTIFGALAGKARRLGVAWQVRSASIWICLHLHAWHLVLPVGWGVSWAVHGLSIHLFPWANSGFLIAWCLGFKSEYPRAR